MVKLNINNQTEVYQLIARKNPELRLGQAIMNEFGRNQVWPELFYEKDANKVWEMMFAYFEFHNVPPGK